MRRQTISQLDKESKMKEMELVLAMNRRRKLALGENAFEIVLTKGDRLKRMMGEN